MNAMQGADMTNASESEREIRTTRVVNAPRELVWRCFTEQKHMQHWWGPRGFTNTYREFSVKPGGHLRFTMHSADGHAWPNHIKFVEVVKPERLVYEHGDGERVHFHVTVTFTSVGRDKTEVVLRSLFPTKAERDLVVEQVGAIDGARETLERLDEELSRAIDEDAVFVIERTLDAPLSLVWKAYTESEHLAQWWAPKGFTTEVKKLDVRKGGLFHYRMYTDSQEMWGRFVYREVVLAKGLVFVSSFSDANAGLTRAPFDPNWPLEMLNDTTFTEERGRTKVRMRVSALGATEAERKTFREGHASMAGGFGSSFDVLAEYLAARKG